jgi:rubrerythrin
MTGIEDFNGYEVLQAAMEVEKGGQKFYTEMANRAESGSVRKLFALLAQDEVQHLRTLKDLIPQFDAGNFWQDEELILPYLNRFKAYELFPSLTQLEVILQQENADKSALNLAIEAEDKFAAYFKFTAEQARSAEGRETFHWLSKEEDRHAAILRERLEQM